MPPLLNEFSIMMVTRWCKRDAKFLIFYALYGQRYALAATYTHCY